MLGRIISTFKRKGFWKKVLGFLGLAVVGTLTAEKIKKTFVESPEKKMYLFEKIRLLKSYWRHIVAVFLIGWGFGALSMVRSLVGKYKMMEVM